MRGIIVLNVFALLLINGCVRIPKHEAQCELFPTPPLEETIDEALQEKTFTTGDFPSDTWWEMFDDPQLSKLILIALQDSPTLQKAEARVRLADNESIIERSRLYPLLGFRADVNWQHYSKNSIFRGYFPGIPGGVTETTLGFDFSYEFDFWGKYRNLFRSSLGMVKARQAEMSQAALILTTAVAASYFKLQWQMIGLDIIKKERTIQTKLVELTKLRQKNALDTDFDTLAVEQALLTLNQTILLYEQLITLEIHTIKTLLGCGPEADIEITPVNWKPYKAFPLPQNIQSDLLHHRPDLMAMIWQVEAAAHQVGAAKADFYPSFDLVAFAGLDSVFFRKLFKWESRSAYLVPGLHLPIFTAGRIRANVNAKYAQFEEMINSYNELLLRALQEVADQIVVLKTSDLQYKEQVSIYQNQKEQLKLTHVKTKNALSNQLDLLRSKDQTLMQKWTVYTMQYNRLTAALSLIRALGGGYYSQECTWIE